MSLTASIDNQAKAGRKLRINSVLRAIDQLHRIENLPLVPVYVKPLQGFEGIIDLNSYGYPTQIVFHRAADHLELTVAHEMGHLIDLMAIGSPCRFASPADPLLKSWRHSVENSNSIRQIRSFLATGHCPSPISDIKVQIYRAQVEEDLTSKEIWARSYAQYVAIRGGNPTLAEQLRGLQNRRGYSKFKQWSDDDFAPIAHEMDKFFKIWGG